MGALTDSPASVAESWRVRPARSEDLLALVALEERSFPVPWTADDYERELARPFSRLRVAEPAGGGTIGGFSNYWIVADEVHLLKVATAPTLRRQGVARSLLRELLEEGRRCHCRLVTLEVRRSNDAAGALYASLGFQTAGVRRRYYENGEDALVMLLCPLPA